MNLFNSITSAISTVKIVEYKAESLLRFHGILEDDMVLVDLLRPTSDILIDDIHNEIVDGISLFYFDSLFSSVIIVVSFLFMFLLMI
jgi:hypothetical protein